MLTIHVCDLSFSSPVLTASGTFGYGDEVVDLVDVNLLGGIVTKSVTLRPREGNPPPRICETPSGMLNSIGLANVGVDKFCHEKLPNLNKLKTHVIVNVAGYAIEDYVETLERIELHNPQITGYEINVSCPNVKQGGMQFGVDPHLTEKLTHELRKKTKKLLILKLSPNVTKIEDIAKAAVNGGADLISAINTIVGMGVDIRSRRPTLNTVFGGLSGPAIKPIALANVHKIFKSVEIPIIGIGGISSAKDVIEFILAGADLVQIGTSNFLNPAVGIHIISELKAYCKKENITSLHGAKGTLEYY